MNNFTPVFGLLMVFSPIFGLQNTYLVVKFLVVAGHAILYTNKSRVGINFFSWNFGL